MAGDGQRPDLLPEEFEDLVEHVGNRLYSYARRQFRLPEDEARDVVSSALDRAVSKLTKPMSADELLKWLAVVGKHLLIDEYRHRLVHARVCQQLAEQAEPSPSPWQHTQALDAAARRRTLLAALSRDEYEFFSSWMHQVNRLIDRPEACRRLGCEMNEYEARKKRLEMVITRKLEELEFEVCDLFTEEESYAFAASGRRGGEEH